MKTLLVSTEGGRFVARGGADSGVLRPGEPVFVPEEVDEWVSVVAPAVRISRLGFHIKASFARQYYSEVGAVHLLLPRDEALLGVPMLFHDRCIAPGEWHDIDTLHDTSFVVTVNDRVGIEMLKKECTLKMSDLRVDEFLQFLSGHMTMKTGDMLVFGDAAIELGSPVADTKVRASIFGAPSLDIKIK